MKEPYKFENFLLAVDGVPLKTDLKDIIIASPLNITLNNTPVVLRLSPEMLKESGEDLQRWHWKISIFDSTENSRILWWWTKFYSALLVIPVAIISCIYTLFSDLIIRTVMDAISFVFSVYGIFISVLLAGTYSEHKKEKRRNEKLLRNYHLRYGIDFREEQSRSFNQRKSSLNINSKEKK